MREDPRCCGTGTCIINEDGICWCGQVWDGEKMYMPNPKEIVDLVRDEHTVDIAVNRSDSNHINLHQPD